MRIEVAPGFFLNVERWGAGPPVVLCHGFTGSARAWGAFGEALGASHTVIALDIVGHGASDSPATLEHYAMEQATLDALAAVEHLGYSRAAWVGYSMGGRFALSVAAAHPGRVAPLALIGASPGLATEAERAARRAADEALALRIERAGIPAFVDSWERIPLFASQEALPAEVRAGIRAGRLRNSATGLANSLRGMGTGAQPPLFDALPSLPMPVLLLAGALDTKFAAIAREMADMIPDAQYVTIPAAGHAAHIERPARCASHVLEFLSGPTRGEGVPA